MALFVSRIKHTSLTNYPLVRLLSSSSSIPPINDQPTSEASEQPERDTNSSPSSFLSDVKASLKLKMQQERENFQHQRVPGPEMEPRFPRQTNSNFSKDSLEDIKKNLASFRSRASSPDPAQQQQQKQSVSFQDLYKRNVNSSNTPENLLNKPKLSSDIIRESLRKMGPNTSTGTTGSSGGGFSFVDLRSRLNLQPKSGNDPMKSNVIGGTKGLPEAVFGKEMKKEEASEAEEMSTEFVNVYSHAELGKRLRDLRPEVRPKEKGWFSLTELNQRLRKLRKLELQEAQSSKGFIGDIRDSLIKIKRKQEEDNVKKNSVQRLSLLGQVTTRQPPQEHLVEKYLHPDNMSSAEKMKIELAKVRDEFKMSDSDCGSSRVQIAQLTTKIKHLSSVLHKKDKHSLKGLLAMVQRRKKLLKYLRRTDWDSYCFVISKLGLRDNPDYKF